MTTRNKYKPDISLEDIYHFVTTHRAETGYDAAVTIDFPHNRTEACITVRLFPVGQGMHTQAIVCTRGGLPLRAMSRQMSAILYVVGAAYRELEANPWLWTPEKRRAVRGG